MTKVRLVLSNPPPALAPPPAGNNISCSDKTGRCSNKGRRSSSSFTTTTSDYSCNNATTIEYNDNKLGKSKQQQQHCRQAVKQFVTKTQKSTLSPWYKCCRYKKDNTPSQAPTTILRNSNNTLTANHHYNDLEQQLNDNNNCNDDVLVSDIIGGFGLYQLLVLIFSGLREGTVGYDAVVLSIITQPENKFRCADTTPISEEDIFSLGYNFMVGSTTNNNNNININNNNSSSDTAQSQCFQHNSGILLKDTNGSPRLCQSFSFHNNNPKSLVIEWNLICQREYLVALIECTYFIGLVLGNVLWGGLADKIGRWRAYIIGHFVAIVFGWASLFAPSVEVFIIFRFFTALGSISYNIIYTIQVEIIGTKYRSYSTILNHLGWGSGVLLVPLAGHYLASYTSIIAVAPCLALLMLPWAFSIPESSRWLMANGYYQKAKCELLRAAQFNRRKHDSLIELKIARLNEKINFERELQELRTNKTSYRLLLTSWSLVRDTIVLACCTFLSHLFYYNLTINFSYFGDISMDANFIISGLGEFIGCIIGALMMKFIPQRRLCIFIFLNALALSFAMQSFVDTNLIPYLNNRIVTTAINALGTISSLTSIFIILIVNQEIYPTIIRQTGSSLVNTIGETGSAAAPFLVQVSQALGQVNSSALFAVMCFVAALSIYCLAETGNSELLDTVNQDVIDNRHKLSMISIPRASLFKFDHDNNNNVKNKTNTMTTKNRSSMSIVNMDNIYWTQQNNNDDMASNQLTDNQKLSNNKYKQERDIKRRMSEDISLAKRYNTPD